MARWDVGWWKPDAGDNIFHMAKTKTQSQGFEESLSALERIVAQLEAGELPLERALEIFEEGVGLARRCQSQLAEAERKVELLLREHGEIKTIPFDLSRDGQTIHAEKSGKNPQIRRPATAGASRQAEGGVDDADDVDEFDETVGDDLDDDTVPF